jgi:hypothetical protein
MKDLLEKVIRRTKPYCRVVIERFHDIRYKNIRIKEKLSRKKSPNKNMAACLRLGDKKSHHYTLTHSPVREGMEGGAFSTGPQE